jgi:hypothetical protein
LLHHRVILSIKIQANLWLTSFFVKILIINYLMHFLTEMC